MNKRFSLLLVFYLAVNAPLCFSGTHWELAVIEKISSDVTGSIHIKLDKTASSICSNKRILLLPTTDGRFDPLLSRAMFAYTTGERIDIYGTGECQGEFEVVSAISKS